MARRIREEDLRAIEEVLRQHPEGRTARQISDACLSRQHVEPCSTASSLSSTVGAWSWRAGAVGRAIACRDGSYW